jgi:hypothetical protein
LGLTENTATALLALNGLHVRPNSAVSVEGTEVGLAGSGQKVAVLAPSGSQVISGFEGESSAAGDRTLVLGPMNAANTWTPCAASSRGCARGRLAHAPLRASATGWAAPLLATSGP